MTKEKVPYRCERSADHYGDHMAHIPGIGEWHWENPRMQPSNVRA